MVEEATPAAQFWAFALAVYSRKAVREIFLQLQDQQGADVPMLLWCLWQGSRGAHIDDAIMAEALAFSAAWRRDRVDPVRALRQSWKGAAGVLPLDLAEEARQEIARAEQAIERLQMNRLAAFAPDAGSSPAKPAMMSNLVLYATITGIDLPEEIVAFLVNQA